MGLRSLFRPNQERTPTPISATEMAGMAKMKNGRECTVCGTEFFQVDSRGSQRKTCSLVCQNKRRRNYMRVWRAKRREKNDRE